MDGARQLAGQTEDNKEQFIHKLSVILNSLVCLVMTSLQTESL
jgi:hypothetical protein